MYLSDAKLRVNIYMEELKKKHFPSSSLYEKKGRGRERGRGGELQV